MLQEAVRLLVGVSGGGRGWVAGPVVVCAMALTSVISLYKWARLEVGVRGGCGGKSYEQQMLNCLYEVCMVLLREPAIGYLVSRV